MCGTLFFTGVKLGPSRNREKRFVALEMWYNRRMRKISWKGRITNENVLRTVQKTGLIGDWSQLEYLAARYVYNNYNGGTNPDWPPREKLWTTLDISSERSGKQKTKPPGVLPPTNLRHADPIERSRTRNSFVIPFLVCGLLVLVSQAHY